MKMKQLGTWPPTFAGGGVKDIERRMADTVLRVLKHGDSPNVLTFRMRGKNAEYSLYLLLPEGLLDKIILTVTPPTDITLGQIGELEIVGI